MNKHGLKHDSPLVSSYEGSVQPQISGCTLFILSAASGPHSRTSISGKCMAKIICTKWSVIGLEVSLHPRLVVSVCSVPELPFGLRERQASDKVSVAGILCCGESKFVCDFSCLWTLLLKVCHFVKI